MEVRIFVLTISLSSIADTPVMAATSRPTSAIAKQSGTSDSDSTNTATAAPSGDEKIAGLSKGAFVGVVVSASCSVLGLLFGIGFKIYKHKKQTKMQRQHIGASRVEYTKE